MKRFVPGLSFSNVVAMLALFVALGGSAYAATHLKPNSIGARQLKRNSVTAAKIKKNSVGTLQIKNGSVTGAKVNVSTLATVPSAASAGVATTADSAGHASIAGSAETLAGYTRRGTVRVAASASSSYKAGLEGAPQILLFTAGPLSVYGQCFIYTGTLDGAVSIKTTQGGAIFDSEENHASGYSHFLDPGTEVEDLTLLEEDIGENQAGINAGGESEFAAMAPDGTTIRGDAQVAVKYGSLAAGNGIYGAGNVCLFASEMTALNG